MSPTKKEYIMSYIPDWVAMIIIGIICWSLNSVPPYNRDFSLQDPTIKHLVKPDTIPFYAAVLMAYIFPLVVICAFSFFKTRCYYSLHIGILSLTLTQAITLFFTTVLKNLAGRPRPDFISRCMINISKINEFNGFGPVNTTSTVRDPFIGFFNRAICTNTNKKVLYNGMRSFPSGHSSASFCGLMFLSLYLASHLHLYNGKGRTYKAIVVATPILVAMVVAVSRTFDNRHHWQDVLAGGILGTLVAYYAYHIYYPSLKAPRCFVPFSSRFNKDDFRHHGSHVGQQSYQLNQLNSPA
ncbi:Lipid phosphate phosphatase 2 [Smittium culicis]|uniref:Lipid phosphate phosphatase 2 n=1 Tax=Smittium culicis TaxID=133412 RepID=A0A1R1YL99_9FUNG|nr:Lipid phosphate phosphatase 2 [Smittium culicis]